MTELVNEVYYEDEIQRDKNRKALLLAQTRFTAQIKPFLSGKPDRLSYVQSELDRIIVEASSETGADESYVGDRFRAYVAEAVAVSEPERIDLEADRPESYPPERNDPAAVDPEPDATTSVLDYGETVLEDEALEPDARVDLNADTQKASCFRCGDELNPVVAAASKVCLDCAGELAKLADANPLALAPSQQSPVQAPTPVDPNARVTCPYCSVKGYHWEGNQTEYDQHVQQQHQQEIQQQQSMPTLNVQTKLRIVSDQSDMSPPNPDPQTVPADEGLSDQANPVHRFDDVVQQLANDAASIQFSTASDDEVNQIAERYGLDPQVVKSHLYVTATFGNSNALNGKAAQSVEPPNGYTEVDMEGMGGRVETHDANVPYELARNKVAQDLGMKPDLIDSMLKDAYGADLGDQYHASVSGEHRFYLPQNMIGAAEALDTQNQNDQAQQQQQVGPTPQPAPQPVAPRPQGNVVQVSLADILAADKRRRR